MMKKNISIPILRKNVLRAIRLGPSFMLCFISFVLGYMTHDISQYAKGNTFKDGYQARNNELSKNTREYTGVVIVNKKNDNVYDVKVPGYVKTYNWEFCHPVKMPSDVVDIKYEQRYGCKQINGIGYLLTHKETKDVDKLNLQNGRDPSASATSTWARLER